MSPHIDKDGCTAWGMRQDAERCACNSLPVQLHCLANKVQALLGLLLRSPGQQICQEGWHQQVFEVCSMKTGVHAVGTSRQSMVSSQSGPTSRMA